MSTAVIVSDTTFFLFLDATQSLFRLLLLQSYMIFPKQTCSNRTKNLLKSDIFIFADLL